MNCFDDRRLFDVHTGDVTPDEHQHLSTCAVCAGRLRALRTDLARIDTVLRETNPPSVRAARHAIAWRWAPLAAAAVLALALGTRQWTGAPVADVDDTLALADELSEAMESTVDFDLDDDATATASATQSTWPSTCTWGDPLLGVGCDEPAVMRIAWR
jgi:hypothetical protein